MYVMGFFVIFLCTESARKFYILLSKFVLFIAAGKIEQMLYDFSASTLVKLSENRIKPIKREIQFTILNQTEMVYLQILANSAYFYYKLDCVNLRTLGVCCR